MDHKKIISAERIFFIIFLLIFIYLFVENFLFSESYEHAVLRQVDDLSFNESLFTWQTYLKNFHYDLYNIFTFNHYGYGWIFWALHGIITFPFFYMNMEQAVVVINRNIPLVMSFLSLYFIYKILGYYSKNIFYKMLALVIILTSHLFLFYSQVFDTTAMIRFCGILSMYFIIKDKDISRKTIILSSLFLGLSIATKIVGLYFAPIVALLLLDRLKFKFSIDNIKKIILFIILLLVFFILFADPGSIIFFKSQTEVSNIVQKIIFQKPDFNLMFETISNDFYGTYITIFLLCLYISNIIRNIKKKEYDFLYYLIVLIAIFIVMTFIDEESSWLFLTKYYSAIIVLLPFSTIELENYKKFGYILAIVMIFLLYQNKQIITDFKYFYDMNNQYKQENAFLLQKDLQKILQPNKDGKILYKQTDTYVVPFSRIRKNVDTDLVDYNKATNTFSSFDDNSDYYIFFKRSTAWYLSNDEELKTYLAKMEEEISHFQNDKIGNSKYKLIYDKYDTMVFKKEE